MQNRIISTAILLTKVSLVLSVSVFALLSGMVIYWYFDSSAFDQWYIVNPFQAGSANFNLQKSPTASGMTFNDLGAGMLLWLMVRTSLFFTLVYLILKRILRILTSVKNARTFYIQNVSHFKEMALIGLVYAIIACFNFGTVNGETTFNFALPFEPVLFAAACWVLSEIFAEGGRLREDSSSII